MEPSDAISRLPFRACHFAPAISRLSVSLVLILTCARFCAADSLTWNANAQGAFITSLCRDIRGNVWIGTEDQGVYRLDPTAPKDKQYSHFTTQNGLGDDNAYALTCDKAGRLWAGTLNHGVSVYNGKTWKTYGPLDGPLGSRVFALAVNPKDGGVWGATEAGLFRYQGGVWTYFTRADGLPSDQANALAFGSDGTLYVGTQCDGIAIASPADNYQSWRVIPGHIQMPAAATGLGLPSHLINCLLVTDSGTVYAGTPTGLAESRDAGMTWSYRRGEDWKDKLTGLYPPVKPFVQPVVGDLLREDYVTSLAEDSAGHLLIGHRQQGLEIVNLRDWKRVFPGPKDKTPTDYVMALLSSQDGTALIGGYGGGLLQTPLPAAPVKASPPPIVPIAASIIASPLPAFPVPAGPPTMKELKVLVTQAEAHKEMLPVGGGTYLGEDWCTKGDWVGKYGSRLAVLCAAGAPFNHEIINDWTYKYDYDLGPNRGVGDSTRHWIQWLHTDDPRVLYDPVIGSRRESEWDDHGEVYSQSAEGPDLWISVTVPAGIHRLTAYFVNKDGHDGSNRNRDYRVELLPWGADVRDLAHATPLASARVHEFWNGVYKSFAVCGPSKFYLHIARNYSVNTIISGLMLDKISGPPTPLEGVQCTYCKSIKYANYVTPPDVAKGNNIGLIEAMPILALWSRFNDAMNEGSVPITISGDRMLCYRALASIASVTSNRKAYDELMSWWRRSLPMETDEDRQAFLPSMSDIYAAEIVAYPAIKNIH